MATFTLGIEFEKITCCIAGCGITFGVPVHWEMIRRNDHTWFYCPNGHRQHYSRETEEERLARELQSALDDAAWEKKEKREAQGSLRATRGVVTRTKNRIKKGICPCCTRTFPNLGAHMTQKHPEYGDG